MVRELLQAEADQDFQSTNGLTVLHVASEKGHLEVVGKLLLAGASKNLETSGGGTAWHLARRAQRLKVLQALERKELP